MKLSHFGFDEILRLEHGHAAMLHAVAYLLLLHPPIEALVRALEVRLLQSHITRSKFKYQLIKIGHGGRMRKGEEPGG